METLRDVLAGFERALALEKELGTRAVDFDRALLVSAPPVQSRVPQAVPPREPQESSLYLVVSSVDDLTGEGGALFDRILAAMKLDRSRVPFEVASAGTAERVLAAKPKCLVLLGKAASVCLGPDVRLARGRWSAWHALPVVATYSPKFILDFTGDRNVLKRELWETLKRALAHAGLSGV